MERMQLSAGGQTPKEKALKGWAAQGSDLVLNSPIIEVRPLPGKGWAGGQSRACYSNLMGAPSA